MTPRPRKASDDEIFAATQRVMMRVGPGDLTLAQIAGEAGITAGALVQRFGSKRELLLAVTSRFAESVGEMFEQLRAGSKTALDTIYLYADCMAQMGESPAALAHHLQYLQMDIADPDFHKTALAQAQATRASLERLVGEAISAGDLPRDADAALIARAIEVTITGSLWTWAFYQQGTASSWMRQDLDALMALWRTSFNSSKEGRSGRG